jgi:hypothetical protein
MLGKEYTVPLLPEKMIAIIRKYAPKEPSKRVYVLPYDTERI